MTAGATLRVLHAPSGLDDWGPWQARSAAVAFDASAAREPAAPEPAAPEPAAPEPTIFRLDLPGGLGAADAALDAVDGWANATLVRLATTPERLDATHRRARSMAAFDVDRLPPADAWLSAQLRGSAAVDYGIGDTVKRALNAIVEMATRLAWVETRVDGELLARSRISIGGDLDTLAKALITPADLQLHLRSVKAARASKNAWMRIMAMVMNVARALAKFAVNPVAGVMALPQAWQYIRRILDEAKLL